MQNKRILLSLLVSPKKELDFHKRSLTDFNQFVQMLKVKRKVEVPIEVYLLSTGKYYISDGVHRSKAAQLAGLDSIDAIIYNDSKPFGITYPLTDVKVPFNM